MWYRFSLLPAALVLMGLLLLFGTGCGQDGVYHSALPDSIVAFTTQKRLQFQDVLRVAPRTTNEFVVYFSHRRKLADIALPGDLTIVEILYGDSERGGLYRPASGTRAQQVEEFRQYLVRRVTTLRDPAWHPSEADLRFAQHLDIDAPILVGIRGVGPATAFRDQWNDTAWLIAPVSSSERTLFLDPERL